MGDLPAAEELPDPDRWPVPEHGIVPLPDSEQMQVYTLLHYINAQWKICHADKKAGGEAPAGTGAAKAPLRVP